MPLVDALSSRTILVCILEGMLAEPWGDVTTAMAAICGRALIARGATILVRQAPTTLT